MWSTSLPVIVVCGLILIIILAWLRKMAGKAETMTLYHYTNEEGAKGIEKEKKIKASTDTTKDAVFGPGVYFTKKGPENSTKTLIRNNYDDNVSHMMKTQKDKTDYVVEVTMRKEDLQKCTDKRDVLKHTGDVDLSKLEYKIKKREVNKGHAYAS